MFTAGRVRVLALALADAVCLCVAWMLAVFGYRLLGGCYDASIYLHFWPVIVVFGAVNAFMGLYHGYVLYPSAPLSPVEEFGRLFLSSLLVHVGVIAFLALRYQTTDGYSRVVISLSGFLVALLAQSFRNWTRLALARLNVAQIPVMLVGGAEVSERLARTLSNNSYFGFRVASRFDEEHLRDVVPAAKKLDIKILLSCQDVRLLRHTLAEFSQWFTYIEYFPTGQTFPIFGSRAISVEGIGGLEMVNQGRMRAKRVQKWLMDTFLALSSLVLLSPLFIILPVLIKLTSRGPVFYQAKRLGKRGKPIWVWKFRSMYVDADKRLDAILAANPALKSEFKHGFKLKKDPRVTAFGKFLRKTSMDELPQLINVLRGEMALVGPRPIVESEISYYGKSYEIMSSVKPGITGLWQVSGRSDCGYDERVAFDVHYILNWTPWLDLWIVYRTIAAVIKMKGSY